MSLSSHLEDKTSPIREFLRTQFSETRTFLRAPRKQVRSADTIIPDIEGTSYPWGTIGMAVDYRIRYYFDVTPHNKLTAYKGAWMLAEPPPFLLQVMPPHLPVASITDLPAGIQSEFPTSIQVGFKQRRDGIAFFDKETGEWLGAYHEAYSILSGEQDSFIFEVSSPSRISMPRSSITSSEINEDTIRSMGERLQELGIGAQKGDDMLPESMYQDFFDGLTDLTSRFSPVDTRLTKSQEDELNRYCVVLALLEEVFRIGVVHPNSPLFAKEHTSAGDLLDIPDARWIADMRNLSWRFYDNLNHLLPLPHSLNPTFDGSCDIGGADADMIVNGTLIDIKTSTQNKIKPDWLWQLLGYVLLDYSDHHRINSIGLYMARQGILLQWDLEEAMRDLCIGEPPSVEELRNEFKAIVEARILRDLPKNVTVEDGHYVAW